MILIIKRTAETKVSAGFSRIWDFPLLSYLTKNENRAGREAEEKVKVKEMELLRMRWVFIKYIYDS